MNENEEKKAHDAWMEHARRHPTVSRSDYIAGYNAGAVEERLRLVAFIGEHQETLTQFAGDKTTELLAYMLRELRPSEAVSS